MALPRRSGRSRLTLALLILTSIAVLTLDFRNSGIVQGARDGAATVLSPLRGVARTASKPFSNGWNGITRYGDVKSENERLRERIDELEGAKVEQADAVDQLTELMAELHLEWAGTIPKVTGRVVASGISNFDHTIEIDKGTKDGVQAGMPVVSGKGLVGKVLSATSDHAIVELITAPDFRVGVKLVPDNVLGTARGTGPGDPLTVDTGLAADTKLAKGGVVTTSGTDRSAFPPSIPVGRVTRTDRAEGGLTLNLVVEPLVDTQRLSFVSVLLREDPG